MCMYIYIYIYTHTPLVRLAQDEVAQRRLDPVTSLFVVVLCCI